MSSVCSWKYHNTCIISGKPICQLLNDFLYFSPSLKHLNFLKSLTLLLSELFVPSNKTMDCCDLALLTGMLLALPCPVPKVCGFQWGLLSMGKVKKPDLHLRFTLTTCVCLPYLLLDSFLGLIPLRTGMSPVYKTLRESKAACSAIGTICFD